MWENSKYTLDIKVVPLSEIFARRDSNIVANKINFVKKEAHEKRGRRLWLTSRNYFLLINLNFWIASSLTIRQTYNYITTPKII